MGPLAPLGPVPAFAGRHYQFQVPPGAGPPGPFLAGGACPIPMCIGVSVRGCRWPWLLPRGGGGLLGSLCAAPDAPARRLLPVPCHPRRCGARGRRVVVPNCQAFVSLHSHCCPAVALAKRGGGAGREWRCGPAHGGNLYHMGGTLPITTRMRWVEISPPMVKESLLPESYTGWQFSPVALPGPPVRRRTGQAFTLQGRLRARNSVTAGLIVSQNRCRCPEKIAHF